MLRLLSNLGEKFRLQRIKWNVGHTLIPKKKSIRFINSRGVFCYFSLYSRGKRPQLKSKSRHTKTITLKDAIQAFLESFNLQNKYSEAHLTASWEKIMGRTIALRTEKIFIRDSTLFLKISSSPLRQELLMAKSHMINLINREMKKKLVDDVVFI